MRRTALASAAILLALTPLLTFADQGPTLYGRANLSLEHQTQDDADSWRLESNASRLGVEGELDLDVAELKGIYQAEFEISFDEGDSDGDIFSLRDTYAGFEHEVLGMLIAGKFDTPLKNAQGEIDQFNDLRADIGNIMGGENRPGNIIRYRTRTFADGLNFNLALILQEASDPKDDDAGNALSSSIVFELEDFYAALAYDKDVTSSLLDAGEVPADTLRAVIRVSLSELELGGLVQRAQDSTEGSSARDTNYLFSAAYTFDQLALKAQYGLTETRVNGGEHHLMAIGADYSLAENSKVFTYYSEVEADDEDTTFGVGFEHKFSM